MITFSAAGARAAIPTIVMSEMYGMKALYDKRRANTVECPLLSALKTIHLSRTYLNDDNQKAGKIAVAEVMDRSQVPDSNGNDSVNKDTKGANGSPKRDLPGAVLNAIWSDPICNVSERLDDRTESK